MSAPTRRQRKATIKARELAACVTTMHMADGRVYQHDPATVGHARHTAQCWQLVLDTTNP